MLGEASPLTICLYVSWTFSMLQEWEAFLGQIVGDVRESQRDSMPSWVDQDRHKTLAALMVQWKKKNPYSLFKLAT